ncbi:hypothetical protein BBJ28_00022662 [Nothophytophthora sp. Chile5]|nr:hypothetical protein BBJ28_00022662 [Nothophytophthora sp. Chile5]
MSGRQLPDRTEDHTAEEAFFYYLAVLTLFKPHRKDTLLSETESVEAAYRTFVRLGPVDVVADMREFEATWLDFYRSQQWDDGNEKSAEAELLRTRAPPTASWFQVDSTSDDESGDLFDDGFGEPDEILALDIDGEKSVEADREFVQANPELQHAIDCTCNAYPVRAERFSPGNMEMDEYLMNVVTGERRLEESETTGTTLFMQAFRDARTRLERLDECFAPVSWPNRDASITPALQECNLPMFPKIVEVSAACQLTFWQHVMFEMTARHLLHAYLKDIENESGEPVISENGRRDTYAIKEQLIGCLGGEAGTGKSRVIHGILTFAGK